MGLGKTVQVLALLHFLKKELSEKNAAPSLVVVPRSLLFNWREEAEKFTPNLKVLVHTGAERQKSGSHFKEYDIILVTYGTMLRDIFYTALKKYYQANLLSNVKKKGMGRSKMRILEALLRLRQAACHPGLVDPAQLEGQSTKLEPLFESLKEVIEEGNKVLVFSQFTSLLAILKKRLERENLRYVYLDGRTKNRKEKVDLFQTDSSYPLFLISLKAGGVGLNS